MTRAEEAALKAYPKIATVPKMVNVEDGTIYDANASKRKYFMQGFEQAEEDIISIIKSRIGEMLGDAQPTPALRAELQDLIKKIKKE